MISSVEKRGSYTRTEIGDLTIWFSYDTPIAFNHPKTGLVVRKNNWGVTTAKHLGYVPSDKSANRVDSTIFEQKWASLFV